MLIVRPVKKDDIETIAQIEQERFSQPWSHASFLDAWKREETIFLAGFEEKRLVCYALLFFAGDEGEIPTIATDALYGRKGYGEQLLKELLLAAQERGVQQIFLEVRQSNLPAQKLYQKCGFTFVGCRKNFYDKPIEDALVMVKNNLEDIC